MRIANEIQRRRVRRIVNLTKHEITIGNIIVPPSGKVIRCKENKLLSEIVEYEGKEIEVYEYEYREVKSIPEREDGTIYLTSYPVAKILCRDDIYCMGEVVRDESGRILGAMCLSKFEVR